MENYGYYELTPNSLIVAPTVVEGVKWARQMCRLDQFRMSMVASMPEQFRGRWHCDVVLLDWDRHNDPVTLARELAVLDPATIDYRTIDQAWGVKRPRRPYTDLLFQQHEFVRLLQHIEAMEESWGSQDLYVSVACNVWTLRRVEAALGRRLSLPIRVVNELPDNSIRAVTMASYDSRLDD